MATLGKLAVKLTAETLAYRRGLLDAEKNTEKFRNKVGQLQQKMARQDAQMKNSKNQLTRYNKAMGAASTAAMGMMRAMLPIAGAAGLLRIGSNAVSTAAQLGRVADRLGVTTDLLQEMRYAGTELGIQQEKMDMALQRFVRRIGEAASGTGEAKAALEEMGIELRDSDGRIRTTGDLPDVEKRRRCVG